MAGLGPRVVLASTLQPLAGLAGEDATAALLAAAAAAAGAYLLAILVLLRLGRLALWRARGVTADRRSAADGSGSGSGTSHRLSLFGGALWLGRRLHCGGDRVASRLRTGSRLVIRLGLDSSVLWTTTRPAENEA